MSWSRSPRTYLSADDYNRLCGLVRAPVDAASEAALTTIARELVLVLEADPRIAARLERTQNRVHVTAD
jgi:hypothetical protein